MRGLVVALAVFGLVAAPCAWEQNPHETPPIGGFLAMLNGNAVASQTSTRSKQITAPEVTLAGTAAEARR